MKKLIILTSSFEPWQKWDEKLFSEFKIHKIRYEYFHVEHDVLKSDSFFADSLVYVRSNTIYAKAICTYLYYYGVNIVNGAATTYYWPRISLMRILQKKNIPVPNSFVSFNLSSLYREMQDENYPLILKGTGAYSEKLKVLHDEKYLLGSSINWSFDAQYNQEPFYLEEYLGKDIDVVKIYVIGRYFYCYKRYEKLSKKLVSRTPEPITIHPQIEECLKKSLIEANLPLVSVDCLISKDDCSLWYVIDINLVPMFSFHPTACSLLSDFFNEQLSS